VCLKTPKGNLISACLANIELKFNYSINQQEILIVLVDVTNQGNCGTYPTPTIDGFDNNCSPKGRVVIPENQFSKGVYILTLKTPNFQIKSEFIVEDDKYELIIPSNDFFSSSIAEDYPMPKNILSGAVVYKGDENTESANNFLDELKNYGFNEIIVPNFDKIPLIDVDKNGNPINRHWPPDKHSLNFYRSMDNNFIEAFNIAQKHFDKSNININIFSSNGDQARLSKTEGVTVVFSN